MIYNFKRVRVIVGREKGYCFKIFKWGLEIFRVYIIIECNIKIFCKFYWLV